MTDAEKAKDWAAYYRASARIGYNFNALIAIYKNDGEKMLRAVLRDLGLESSAELVKDAAKRE